MTPPLGLSAVNHRYFWRTDTESVGPLPSVTGITRMQDNLGGSDGLLRWGVALALDHFAQTGDRDASIAALDGPANLGTLVHDQVRAILVGEKVYPTPESVWHLAQFARFLGIYRPDVLHAEQMVANLELGYGGQFDFIAVIHGKTALVDVKTGKHKASHRLQLAGYAMAEFIGREGSPDRMPMPTIEAAYVLLLHQDEYELVDATPTEADYAHFRTLADIYKRMKDWPPKKEKAA